MDFTRFWVILKCVSFSVQDKSMYDASHELQYLDMVMEETLRMYPPATAYVQANSVITS